MGFINLQFIFAIMTIENAIASKLLEVGAVKLNSEIPFTWTSGLKSPIYCDNRRLLSFPMQRDFVKSELCRVIFEEFPDADVLAGVATAGIPWGAMAADQLKMPFIYVRPTPKSHGLGNQIEGYLEEGKKVLVIEDLISTGKSSLEVCKVINEAKCEVSGMVSIFNYNFESTIESFNKAGINLRSLSNYQNLIEVALTKNLIKVENIDSLLKWRMDPVSWA